MHLDQGASAPDSAEIYLLNRPMIEGAIAAVCRRRRLSADETEQFSSDARFHLIRNDYAALRAFKGRSSFQTFVIAVVSHLLQDWRNARWGKWRPSAEARRLGPVAVRLETLLVRDGYTLDEAGEVLRTNLGVSISPPEIESLWKRLPERTRRSHATDESLQHVLTVERGPDVRLAAAEAAITITRARDALQEALACLPSQDRLILRMRFEDGLRIREVARLLRLDDKQLYRRIDRMLGDLRRSLESSGISREVTMAAMEAHGFDAADLEVTPGKTGSQVRLLDSGRSRPASGRWL